MGIELAQAFVAIRGDASRFASDVNAAKPGIMSSVTALAGGLRGVFGTIGVGLGIWEMVSMVKSAMREGEEAINVEQLLKASVAATGQAAGFTADQMIEMAGKMSLATNIVDEDIMRAMARLTQFGKVGHDVFEQTVSAALDMSAKGFGDASGAARMLGMALEDPVRGADRLRRSGVILSATQKEQIKNFVATNQLSKAQGVILGEVESKMGGVAKAMTQTTAGQVKGRRILLGELREALGKKMMPLGNIFLDMQIGMQKAFNAVLGAIGDAYPYIVASLEMIGNFSSSMADFFAASWELAVDWVSGLISKDFVKGFAGAFKTIADNLDVLFGSFKGFGVGVMTAVNQTWVALKAVWEQATYYISTSWSVVCSGMQSAWVAMISFLSQVWDDWASSLMGSKLYQQIMAKVLAEPTALLTGMRGDDAAEIEKKMIEEMQGNAGGLQARTAERGAAASKQQTAIADKLKEELKAKRDAHDQSMVEIGNLSLELTKVWEDFKKGAPKFSEAFGAAVNRVRAGLQFPEIPIKPKPEIDARKSRGAIEGVMGIQDFGKKIQEVLLKNDAAKVAKEQLGIQKIIGIGVRDLVLQGKKKAPLGMK